MGGLAHYFEEEGLPTTQISLVRMHTEAIKPPRSLWVPFEFGRPLGVPNDIPFQTRVLQSVLKLFEASNGPVLEDFPEDAPISDYAGTGWACPVNLTKKETKLSSADQLRSSFKKEIIQLRSWYDLAVERRGRTTVGLSGLDIETIGDFLGGFIGGSIPENPRKDVPLGNMLKYAVDDLKAYYFEAVTAQPSRPSPESNQLADWFWGETVAAQVILRIKESCASSDDELLQTVSLMFLVPLDQLHSLA